VIEEAGKMGMAAFYAGLILGMLLGVLLVSLWALYLAKTFDGVRSGRAVGYSPEKLLKPEPGIPALPRS
jgi:hypothetical protein